MMEIHNVPVGDRSGKLRMKPLRLYGCAVRAVRLCGIAVEHKVMDIAPDKIIISFISGKSEILQVRSGVRRSPVMVTEAWKKFIGIGSRTRASLVITYVIMEVFSDVNV